MAKTKKRKVTKKRTGIFFETWTLRNKRRRVIVYRKESRVQTWRIQKNSGIRTKQQAIEQYKQTQTFHPKRARVRSKETTPKTVSIPETARVTQIGVNTGIITTKDTKVQREYQYRAVVTWGDKGTTTGYSRMKGTKQQAFHFALAEAINQRIVGYESHTIQWTSHTSGIAQAKREKILFYVQYDILNWVKTA